MYETSCSVDVRGRGKESLFGTSVRELRDLGDVTKHGLRQLHESGARRIDVARQQLSLSIDVGDGDLVAAKGEEHVDRPRSRPMRNATSGAKGQDFMTERPKGYMRGS